MRNTSSGPVISRLSDAFDEKDVKDSYVGQRLARMVRESQREETPPFPRQIQIETSNICNHGCLFCAYTLMKRPKRVIDHELFQRLVREAYECGAREIGLFAGAEPLTCRSIEEFVRFCHRVGYEYQYISTNGAIGQPEQLGRLLDAGLSSIKFSVNGGDRETYRKVHLRDDFDKVLSSIRFVNAYRQKLSREIFLGVSFVAMGDTAHTFKNLTQLIGSEVDEIIYYEAANQSGQMPAFPLPPYRDCHLPFNKAHFSVEGFLKACCNDYENLLAIEDLNRMSLKEAWHSPRFREFRRRHIEDDLEGTVCANCIRSSVSSPHALNSELVMHEVFWGKT